MATDSTVRISTTQPITISATVANCTVIQCAEAAALLLHIPVAPATAPQVVTYWSSDEAGGTYVKMKYYSNEGDIQQQLTYAGMYSTPAELFAAKCVKVVATSGTDFGANAILKT